MICCLLVVFFFCKQKTAYEMRISDWSSDVCSSDLTDDLHVLARLGQMLPLGGALLPPAAEVAFETALALTAIIVILAVQRFYLAVPPLVIVAVALIRHTAEIGRAHF